MLSYINNQRFSVDVNSDSIHHNQNPEPSSSAPVDLAESQVILIKTNENKTAQDFNVESYINLLKNGASEDHLSRDKPKKIKGFGEFITTITLRVFRSTVHDVFIAT